MSYTFRAAGKRVVQTGKRGTRYSCNSESTFAKRKKNTEVQRPKATTPPASQLPDHVWRYSTGLVPQWHHSQKLRRRNSQHGLGTAALTNVPMAGYEMFKTRVIAIPLPTFQVKAEDDDVSSCATDYSWLTATNTFTSAKYNEIKMEEGNENDTEHVPWSSQVPTTKPNFENGPETAATELLIELLAACGRSNST